MSEWKKPTAPHEVFGMSKQRYDSIRAEEVPITNIARGLDNITRGAVAKFGPEHGYKVAARSNFLANMHNVAASGYNEFKEPELLDDAERGWVMLRNVGHNVFDFPFDTDADGEQGELHTFEGHQAHSIVNDKDHSIDKQPEVIKQFKRPKDIN